MGNNASGQVVNESVNEPGGQLVSEPVSEPGGGELPKTCIFSITTHGAFFLTELQPGSEPIVSQIPTFRLPNKIKKFAWFKAVQPGVLNIGSEECGNMNQLQFLDALISTANNSEERLKIFKNSDANSINIEIRKEIDHYYGSFERLQTAGKGPLLQIIKDAMLSIMKQNLTFYTTEATTLEKKKQTQPLRFKKKDNDDLISAINYINGFADASMRLDTAISNFYDPDRTVANKTFNLGPGDTAIHEDWEISCLNFNFGESPNIFSEVHGSVNKLGGPSRQTNTQRYVEMSQLLNWAADHGAEEVICIDWTCCPLLLPPSVETIKEGDDVTFKPANSKESIDGIIESIRPGGTYSINTRDGRHFNGVKNVTKSTTCYITLDPTNTETKKDFDTAKLYLQSGLMFGGRRKRNNNKIKKRNNTKKKKK